MLAAADTFSTYQDVPITIGIQELLSNDAPGVTFDHSDPKCVLTPDANGCTYTPATAFTGTDTFTYTVRDAQNNPGSANVSIRVTPIELHAAFSVTCANRTCTAHPTSWGTLPVTRWLWNWGDGSPTVEPTAPYPWVDQAYAYARSGRYTLTHTIYDSAGHSNSLQLAVLADTPPMAANDTVSTDRDVPVTIDVLANDSDADNDPLSIFNVNLSAYPGAAYQAVQVGSRWALKVTPPDSFVGTMTFAYTACDNWGLCAPPATVTLTVKQWTVVVDALGEQFYCAQNGSIRMPLATLLANDYSDLTPLSIVAMDSSILMGSLNCTSDPTACTYTPPLNAAGYTLFRYTVSDPSGHRDTATVRLYVGTHGNPPGASDDYFTTPASTAKSFTVQDVVQNDTDPDGDTLTVGLASGARDFGSLSCSTPMYRCTYTPNAGFVGTDRFSYTASDTLNPAAIAFINVLTLPSTTPTFDAREDLVITSVNVQTYISNAFLTSNDYDPSGYPITVTSLDSTGIIGTLTCDGSGCTYRPPYSFQGTTRFKYTATNGHGATDIAVVKIRVGGTNQAPVAVADTLSTRQNTPLRFSVFDLLRNDYDPDNDPLTVTVYPTTAHKGTLSCGNPAYWCTYTPAANVTGADVLTYLLSDGTTSVASTVTINIVP